MSFAIINVSEVWYPFRPQRSDETFHYMHSVSISLTKILITLQDELLFLEITRDTLRWKTYRSRKQRED